MGLTGCVITMGSVMDKNMVAVWVIGLSILVGYMIVGVWWCIKEMRRQYQESINPHNWEVGYVYTRDENKRYILVYKGRKAYQGEWRSECVARDWLQSHRDVWDDKMLAGQRPIIIPDK